MAEESVADDQLAAFVDRILRMKGEEDAIKSDIKEIYAEAKAMGYDKTRLGDVVSHVRKHEKDAAGEAEKEAIRDLYLTAYYRAKNKPHTHAPARATESPTQNTSVSVAFDSETGEFDTTQEITETQSAPQAAQMHDVEVGGEPIIDVAITSPAGAEGIVDRQAITEPDATPAGAVVADTSGVTGGESAATNVSTLRQPAPLRPNCLNRDKCGGQGRNHCWSCQKAMNERASA